jgi:hypothetical protein
LIPKVICGLKGPLLSLSKNPPLLAGAQTAFKIAVNKLLNEVIVFLMIIFLFVFYTLIGEKSLRKN